MPIKKRECLKCGNDFDSDSVHHRICPYCRVLNERTQHKSAYKAGKARAVDRGI